MAVPHWSAKGQGKAPGQRVRRTKSPWSWRQFLISETKIRRAETATQRATDGG